MDFDEIRCNRMRLGAIWLDLAWLIFLVSIWLIPAPFGSIQLESGRLDLIGLDWARLSPICPYSVLFRSIQLFSSLFISV